jgi:predicted kinase
MGKGVVLFTGLQGTGKTTSAGKLKQELDFDYISNISIRRELGHKRYIPGQSALVNEVLYGRLAYSLQHNLGVILDSTFSKAAAREKVYSIASDYSANVVLLETIAPERIAKSRISRRQKNSGIVMEPTDPAIYEREKIEREPVSPAEVQLHENLSYVRFDTFKNSFEPVKVTYESEDLVGRIEDALTGIRSGRKRQEAIASL